MKIRCDSGLPWFLRQQRICLQCRKRRFNPWDGKILWRRKWLPTPVFFFFFSFFLSTPVFLPSKSHGQRSLVGYSPWGRQESDMTEQLFNTLLKEVACCTQSSFQFLREVSPCTFLLHASPALSPSGSPCHVCSQGLRTLPWLF